MTSFLLGLGFVFTLNTEILKDFQLGSAVRIFQRTFCPLYRQKIRKELD